jgi:hypothetical protein
LQNKIVTDKEFAFYTVLVSSVSAILASLITNLVTVFSNRMVEKRERIAFARQLRKEKVETTRLLYEEATVVLNNVIIERGLVNEERQNKATQILARLDLRATH